MVDTVVAACFERVRVPIKPSSGTEREAAYAGCSESKSSAVIEFYGGAVKWLVLRLPHGQFTLAFTLGHTVLGQSDASLDISREHELVHVRQFERWGPFMGLLYMVDAGQASGTVSNHLSAIRTIFDKFCGRHLTLGLVTPRRPKRLPVILSPEEVKALLQAATSLRDKLILGLMYATGMRVSEVVRVRWRDIDFDRRLINVWQGKGRTDRQVTLPSCYEPLLKELSRGFTGDDFLFPSEANTRHRRQRHLSPRTAERIMERAVRIAGIKKRATPHSLRHSFATHSYEDGCDIRRIQKALGHVRLETTTIYVKVARPSREKAPSPLDKLYHIAAKSSTNSKPVGLLQIHFQQQPSERKGCRRSKVTLAVQSSSRPIYFTGILASEVRPGYVTLQIPPLEDWAQPLRWLSRGQRERLEEPEFYETLQREISSRLLKLPAVP